MSAFEFRMCLLWAMGWISHSTTETSGRSAVSMPNDFGGLIDQTLLRATATTSDSRRPCAEARDFGMAAVCVFPYHVPLAREVLRDTRVKIASVIGFPFGATFTEIKANEMRMTAAQG